MLASCRTISRAWCSTSCWLLCYSVDTPYCHPHIIGVDCYKPCWLLFPWHRPLPHTDNDCCNVSYILVSPGAATNRYTIDCCMSLPRHSDLMSIICDFFRSDASYHCWLCNATALATCCRNYQTSVAWAMSHSILSKCSTRTPNRRTLPVCFIWNWSISLQCKFHYNATTLFYTSVETFLSS